MNPNYSFISNGNIMILLCSVVIIAVIIQSVIFLRIGFKRGKELNIDSKDMKKVVTSSAIFSVIPSLPILVGYMLLIPALGKFLPWVRLSVIGSVAYETMAADFAVKAFGYSSLSDAFTPEAYAGIAWTVTLCILLSVMALYVIKPFDKKMKQYKSNKFMPLLISGMFLGLLSSIGAPYLVSFKNPVTIVTVLVSSITVVIFNKLGKNRKMLKEFSFAASMVIGMISAAVFSAIIS